MPSSAPSPSPGRRGRRLALVALLVPGAAGLIAAVNVWSNPWLLILSLAWILAVVWRLRGVIAGELAPAPPSSTSPELEP